MITIRTEKGMWAALAALCLGAALFAGAPAAFAQETADAPQAADAVAADGALSIEDAAGAPDAPAPEGALASDETGEDDGAAGAVPDGQPLVEAEEGPESVQVPETVQPAVAQDGEQGLSETIEGEGAALPDAAAEPIAADKADGAYSAQGGDYPDVSLEFRVHVQAIGDQEARTIEGDGKSAVAGTSGQALRLEALWMKLSTALAGSVTYQVHVQDEGWQAVKSNGAQAGTTGLARRLEGAKIDLVGEVSKYYDIEYRAHIENIGWQNWVKNGAFAGTEGKALRMEALEVRLVQKDSIGEANEGIIDLVYRGHVQDIGDQAHKRNGETAGTVGQAKRMEAVQLDLQTGMYGGGLSVEAHVENKGWMSAAKSGQWAGSRGQGLRLEALKVALTGEISTVYDVVYRAHVSNIGWQPWVTNGAVAGTSGRALPIEALEVKLVKKGSEYALSEGTYVFSFVNDAASAIAPNGAALKKGSYSATADEGKFYVRNELGGVTLQSVSTGKFVKAGNALDAWSEVADMAWKVMWNNGLKLANVATGALLSVTGVDAFMANPTGLINNGTYIVKNAASGAVMDVANASWSSGANIMVFSANNGGNQVFRFENTSGPWYKITNAMTNLGVDLANASTAEGANIQQCSVNSSAAQQWKPQLDRNGKLYITNRASSKALTAEGTAAAGSNVTSRSYTGAANQQWTLTPGSWSLTGDSELDRYIMGIVASCNRDLRACFDWMGNLGHVNYVNDITVYGRADNATMNIFARAGMERGVADCYVDGALFAWLARACGYEAYFRGGGCPSVSGTLPHGWTEVIIDGVTYVCDSNLRRDMPSYNWYMNTYSNAPVTYSIW